MQRDAPEGAVRHPVSRRDVGALALIATAWALAILLVDPRGEFPVTDDWAYAASVRALVHEHSLRFSDWGATNLLTQTLWGSAWGALFGTSYTVLRASTLAAGLAGALAFYRTMRLADASPALGLLGTAVFAFNPLYLALSFSFMSDVPYAVLQTLALWLLAGGLVLSSPRRRWLGWGVAVAALLVRQVAIAIPAGVGAAVALRRPFAWRRVAQAALAIAAFALVQAGYQHWLRVTGIAPRQYGRQVDDMLAVLTGDPVYLIRQVAYGLFFFWTYCGWFALPLTVALAPATLQVLGLTGRPGRIALLAVLPLAAIVAGIVAYGRPMPFWRDQVTASGIQTFFPGPVSPLWFRYAVTAIAAGGALLLLGAIAAASKVLALRRGPQAEIGIAAALTGLVLIAPMLAMSARFDRYLIPVVPCLCLALACLERERVSHRAARIGAVAAALMATASVVLAHDGLAAQRAHAAAYAALVRHIPAALVDGGFVLNGAAQYEQHRDDAWGEHWYDRRDWIVTAGKRAEPGYRIVARWPAGRWLDWGEPVPIVVQQRLR